MLGWGCPWQIMPGPLTGLAWRLYQEKAPPGIIWPIWQNRTPRPFLLPSICPEIFFVASLPTSVVLGGEFSPHDNKKHGHANTTKEFEWSNQVYVIGNGCLRKDPNSHLLDQQWMWSIISIDLPTCWIAKPYSLPPLYHNCTIFQLVAIINSIPSSMVDRWK
jgi:hypothetical protein